MSVFRHVLGGVYCRHSASSLSLIHILDAIKELIALGQEKGFLTYKEIADALHGLEMTEEQVDQAYKAFQDMGVEVVSERQSASGALSLRGGQGATGTAVRSRAAKPIPLSDENAEDESVDNTAEDDSDEAEDKEETTDKMCIRDRCCAFLRPG